MLPLVLHYNKNVKRVKDLISVDLCNGQFIQYHVLPAKNLNAQLKKAEGFRVYHLVGWNYSKQGFGGYFRGNIGVFYSLQTHRNPEETVYTMSVT